MSVALSPPAASFGIFGSRPKFRPSMMADDPGAMQPGQARPLNAMDIPPAQAPAINAREQSPGHWTIGGFDNLQEQTANLPRLQQPQGPLGGSMRQPFDYAGALKTLQGDQKKIGSGRRIAAAIADAMMAFSGNRPWATQYLLSQQQDQQSRKQQALETVLGWQHNAWQDQNQADLRAANPFTIGRDRLQYDPATGQTATIYDGPEDFELYAQELGLKPGTPDYFKAVEDHIMRSSGPSAHERDMELDDYRTENDRSLENLRYSNRVGMENLRQGNRRGMVNYRNNNPPPSRSRGAGGLVGSKNGGGDVVTVKTVSEAQALPKGTRFRTPDGRIKVR